MEEWENKVNEASHNAKALIDDYFKNSNYDGVIVNNDVGSFGRSTKTFIAFENTQVKSATDNIGTFDGNNPDIRYSLDEDYDFTDEKAGAIHDTLNFSIDDEYDDWLVNDDGKNNINDLIKETVALETTGKTGFFYLDKKRTQNIFKKSGYQLPSQLKNSGSNIIIRTIDDSVNKKSIILLKANNLSDGSVIGKIALQKQVKR